MSEIARRLNQLVDTDRLKKIMSRSIIYYLTGEKILEEYISPSGKKVRRPTMLGKELGITIEKRTALDREYSLITYSRTAQEYIIQSVWDIAGINEKKPWLSSGDEDEK